MASAPGKVVLFGEHAVVYGHPAISASISQRTTVSVQALDEPGLHLNHMKVNPARHPHLTSLMHRLWNDSVAKGVDVSVQSDVPRGAGLGSSAAFAVASATALRAASGRWVDADTGAWHEGYPSDGSEVGLFEGEAREPLRTDTSVRVHGQAAVSAEEASLLGHIGEALSQEGRASPMDTMTSAYGGLVMLSNRVEDESTWVMKRTMPMGDEQRTWDLHHLGEFHLEDGLSLVVGHTGINAPTTHMVCLLYTSPSPRDRG